MSLFSARTSLAVTIDLPLTFSASENELDIGVETTVLFLTPSATDTTSLSGFVDASLGLELTPAGAEVSGIRFNSGSVSAGEISLTIGLGLLPAIVIQSDENNPLSGSVETIDPGLSPVSGGAFAAEDHQVLIDAGVLNVSGFVDATIDLADGSVGPLEFGLVGDGGVNLVLDSVVDGLATYDVEVTLPISTEQEIAFDGNLATVSGDADLLARGRFSVPLPLAGDANGDGVVNIADFPILRDRNDLAGLALLQANFGAGTLAAAAAPIPEPTSALLASWVLLAALATRSVACRGSQQKKLAL